MEFDAKLPLFWRHFTLSSAVPLASLLCSVIGAMRYNTDDLLGPKTKNNAGEQIKRKKKTLDFGTSLMHHQIIYFPLPSWAKMDEGKAHSSHNELIPELNKRKGVSGNRVLWHVGMPLHHRAAQGAAKDPHVPRFIPLMGVCVIVLYSVRDGVAVETTHDEKPILKDFYSKVAARAKHGSNGWPAVCFRAVGLNAS